jgi:hypothetical protein
MRKDENIGGITLGIVLFLLGGCAAGGPGRESPPDGSEGVASATSYMEAPKPSPLLSQLLSTLKPLGYDGIGLEFESDTTLELLNRIFESPRAAGRRIKLMYTGLALSYDPKHESLTVGGTSDLEAILKYIEKNVPARPAAPATK